MSGIDSATERPLLVQDSCDAEEIVVAVVDVDAAAPVVSIATWLDGDRGPAGSSRPAAHARRAMAFQAGDPTAHRRGETLAIIQLGLGEWERLRRLVAVDPGAVVGYRALGPVHRRAEPPAADTPPGLVGDTRHLVLIESECDQPERVEEFNRWYDERHLPDVLRSPGYQSAWRLEIIEPTPGRARFLTIYELHTDDLAATYEHRVRMRQVELAAGGYDGAIGLAPFSSDGFQERTV